MKPILRPISETNFGNQFWKPTFETYFENLFWKPIWKPTFETCLEPYFGNLLWKITLKTHFGILRTNFGKHAMETYFENILWKPNLEYLETNELWKQGYIISFPLNYFNTLNFATCPRS